MAPPVILSMDVSGRDDSDYRILVSNRVRYVTIAQGTFDRDTLFMPLSSLPKLPEAHTWDVAWVYRNPATGQIAMDLQQRALAGITSPWHPVLIDCLDLKRTRRITGITYEANYTGDQPLTTSSSVIAKVARFEWEIPRLLQETLMYKSLQDTGLAPRFVGHVHEHGRVIGFILEKLEGRAANIDDLPSCQSALRRLHDMGILHGDVNRYNFIVQNDTVRLLDSEKSQICDASDARMQAEMDCLVDELVEETGRGAGFQELGETD